MPSGPVTLQNTIKPSTPQKTLAMPASPLNNSIRSTQENQEWVHMTITKSTSELPPIKGEKIPIPPPATAQEGWNDDRFLPHNSTPISPPYSGPVKTKEQRKAKGAALHQGLSWTEGSDDQCPVHLSEKQGAHWFPKKISKKGKEPARDMEWETAYDAEPESDRAPPRQATKEIEAYKALFKWQHCFRDNCSFYRWKKVDVRYYPRIVGKDGVLSRQDETYRNRRRTVRRQHGQEGGEKTSSDIEWS